MFRFITKTKLHKFISATLISILAVKCSGDAVRA